MVWPMNTTGPSDEISRRMARPSVVLPEPDSPTTPSVSPLRISMLTPSTALMWPTILRMTPRLIGNQTLRSLVETTTGALRPRRRRIGLRLGGEQFARIGMLGRGEHALDRAALDDLALVHHADAVGDLAHDAEVVGDEQHRHAEPGLRVLEQLEDLRLHGDVERGRRLVGDQQVRLVGQRHGDHHALALAAGKLVRIAAEPPGRIANADLAEQIDDLVARLGAGEAVVQQQNFPDLLLDRVQRIERRHRLLEDDGDVVAAHLRGFRFSGMLSSSRPLKRTEPDG